MSAERAPTGKVFFARLIWDREHLWPTVDGYFDIVVRQEERWPFGRKGNVLAGLWKSLERTGIDGVVINDNDVIIDPHDQECMVQSIRTDPFAVHTAPVKLWPASTRDKRWCWSHGLEGVRNQVDHDLPEWFGFGFTYLPARLLDGAVEAGLSTWMYPWVDTKVGEMARSLDIKIVVVRNGCCPKHINF